MYNRILKRPMFRIGGQAGQGTGIMSHVEPKPTYAVGGRVGFRNGSDMFDYIRDFFGPEIINQEEANRRIQEGNLYRYNPRNPEEILPFIPAGRLGTGLSVIKNAGKGIKNVGTETYPQVLDKYGRYITKKEVPDFIAGPKGISPYQAPGFGTNAAIKEAIAPYLSGAKEITMSGLNKVKDYGIAALGIGGAGGAAGYGIYDSLNSSKKPVSYKETNPAGSLLAYKNLTSPGTITTAINENGDLVDRSTGELLDREPGNTNKTTTVPPKPIPKDPKQQIKEEADFIRDLVKDEDMTTAEAAFVVARALATPGGIGEKVKAANELLIPMAKEKSKTKKDITLEAYKAYKDKQLEEIKAGKLSDWGKAAKEAAENAKLAGDKRPIEEIIKEYNDLKFGEEKLYDKIIAGSKINDLSIIIGKVRSIRDVEDRLQNNEKVDKDEKKLYEKNKREVEKFKLENPEIFKKYYGAKDGGRIGFAYGSPEPEQQPQIESTTLDQGSNETQLKPVVKLSYQELRARLPKEISDNIILLLSNSDQALQDFAYIATQQDINDFNVKYGVNLVLPSNK